MSELTTVLNQLFTTLQNLGEPVETLRPGLSREQIERVVSVLPFRLPQEVYELYQWRDGSIGITFFFSQQHGWRNEEPNLLPDYRLLPLKEAVRHAQHLVKTKQWTSDPLSEEWAYHEESVRRGLESEESFLQSIQFIRDHPDYLFPLLASPNDVCYYYVLGSEADAATGKVLENDVDELPLLVTDSLLNLFRSAVESWARGVFKPNPITWAKWSEEAEPPEWLDTRCGPAFLVDQEEWRRILRKNGGASPA